MIASTPSKHIKDMNVQELHIVAEAFNIPTNQSLSALRSKVADAVFYEHIKQFKQSKTI